MFYMIFDIINFIEINYYILYIKIFYMMIKLIKFKVYILTVNNLLIFL